jgi:hypothetical protein
MGNPTLPGSNVERPEGESVFREALLTTLSTLEQRARAYRNVVVLVSLVSIGSIIIAGVLRRWDGLLGLLLLAPLSGALLFLDTRRVRRWQAVILEMWQARSLGMTHFRETITSFRHLPRDSLDGMLATLPQKTADFDPDRASVAERATVAAGLEVVTRRHERSMLLATGAILAAVSLLGAAMALRSVAVLGLVAVPAAIVILLRRTAQRIR